MILINSSPKDALKIFQPFLPIFMPVGIGYLHVALEKDGIETKLIDEQVEPDVMGKVEAYVQDLSKPYIFGLSVLTAAYRSAIVLSKKLKERYPDSVIVLGGPHPTAVPEEALAYDFIDAVIRGEGELILPDFYRAVKEGRDYTNLQNLSYKKDGKIIHNDRTQQVSNIDLVPPFPYHKFTDTRYDLGFVVSSRGCPYHCIFCSNRITTGQKYRYRSAESIVADLKMLFEKYNKRSILFLDDNFLVNKKRIYDLIGAIKAEGLDKEMTFNFQARADNADPKILKDLFDAGFKSIFYGIETASEEIMKIINKGETVHECVKAVKMAKGLGFHVSATFIYGLPGETHKDRMDAARLSRYLELDMVRFNNATPYPGTALYAIAQKDNKLNIVGLYENFYSVSTFIENPFSPIPFSYVPAGNSEQEIRNDILFSYLVFYLDFKKVASIFANPEKGVGWFNAGEKLIEIIKMIPSIILLILLISIKFGKLVLGIFLRQDTAITISEFFRSINWTKTSARSTFTDFDERYK